jgi:hypothetical protein
LRPHGAGAERNIFGSTTLLFSPLLLELGNNNRRWYARQPYPTAVSVDTMVSVADKLMKEYDWICPLISLCVCVCDGIYPWISLCVSVSVADPDPPDPHIFGPPGPGSDPLVRGIDPDPDPSIIEQK